MAEKWYAENTAQELTRSRVPGYLNTSMRKGWTAEDVIQFNIYPIIETTRPDVTILQNTEPGELIKVNNTYHRSWNIVNKYSIQEEVDAAIVSETLRQQQVLIQHCESAVVAYIQAPIDAYNTANNTLFSDAHSCANYATVSGYTHQTFCTNVWAWNVQVWEAARQILADALAGTVAITSVNDLLTLLHAWVE